MKTILFLLLSVLLFSCSNNNTDEVDALKKQLAECEKENKELKETPDALLIEGQKLLKQGQREKAITVLQKICSKAPDSDQCKRSKVITDSVLTIIEKEEAELARIKAEGFKVLKEELFYTNGEVKINFSGFSTGNSFYFDNYGSGYMYNSAMRNNTYITSNTTITAESNNPDLPAVLLFEIKDGKAEQIGVFDYRFASWQDYGYYLGNYHDKTNDFYYTPKIRFNIGYQIYSDQLKNKVLIIAVRKNDNGSFTRTESEYSNPPVSYAYQGNEEQTSFSAEEFVKNFTVLKIFNRGKL